MAKPERNSDSDDAPGKGIVKRSAAATADQRSKAADFNPPRRARRGILIFLALLAAVVVFAPQIAARTPLLGRLIDWATSDVRGKFTFGEASLSWFAPPSVKSVRLHDAQGELVCEADAVSADRTLWTLTRTSRQLGRLRIERPKLLLRLRADGTTNLEEILSKLWEGPSSGGVDVAVEVVDGSAEIHDDATGRHWTLEKLDGVVIVPAGSESPTTIDAKAMLTTASGPRPLSLKLDWRNTAQAEQPYAPQGSAALAATEFPLDLAQALGRRYLPAINVRGSLTADLRSKFDLATGKPAASLEGRIGAVNLSVGGPALGDGELQLARLDVPVRATIDGEKLVVDELAVNCDVGSLAVQGTIDRYPRLFDLGVGNALDILTLYDGQATLRAGLARVAQVAPQLLRLRRDIQVTGGDITLAFRTPRDAGGAKLWQAEVNVAGLTARSGGTIVAWEQPIAAGVSARQTAAGPVIEQVRCQSDFLSIEGTNSPRSFDLTARYSLARLVEQAGRFFDLGGLQLRGEGTGEASWSRDPTGRFQLAGNTTVNGFEFILPDYPVWSEQQMIVGFQATGRAAGLSVQSLDQAVVGVQSAGDQLTVQLAAPLADVTDAATYWPLQLEGRGQLATWLRRIRPFAGLPAAMTAEGQAELTAVGRYRWPDDVEIAQSTLRSSPLRLAAYGFAVDEPSAELTLAGRYTSEQIDVREAVLKSPGTELLLHNFLYRMVPDGPAEITGDLAARVDLAKLLSPTMGVAAPPLAVGLPGLPARQPTSQPLRVEGKLEGTAKLARAGDVISLAVDSLIRDLAVGQGAAVAWREPQLRIIGSGVYEPQRDQLSVDRLELTAEALRLALGGRLSQLTGGRVVDCSGEATYDLARLTPIAQSWLGSGVALSGKRTQQFRVSGPTSDPRRDGAIPWEKLTAAAQLGWDRLDLYGVAIGPGSLDAQLQQGWLTVSPLEVSVSTGRVRLAPALRVGPEPKELQLAPGMLVDHVTITPEMANERLKYIAPIMAGVAQVGGQFSVQILECRLPTANPAAGAISGKLTVHDVELGPGLLTRELATLLQQPLTVRLARESTVDFKMIEGRIYHQNLEFAFPEVTVRTMGSVGIVDQSVSLIAEMPIPAKLLGDRPIAQAALSGQSIRLPVNGTLSNFSVDRQEFARALAQTARGSLEGAAREGLNRGLNRLLGPSGALAPPPGTGNR